MNVSNLFKVLAALHDRMTQCRMDKKPDPWYEVDIVGQGRTALETVNDHLGKIMTSPNTLK